jgi:anti-anti-sigma factor
MSTKLEVSEWSGGVRILKLTGQLDITGVAAVETRFYAHCGGDKIQVRVDLEGVAFLSSLGIRMLLQAAKAVKARGGQLQFLNPQSVVNTALEISGLGSLIFRGDATDGDK